MNDNYRSAVLKHRMHIVNNTFNWDAFIDYSQVLTNWINYAIKMNDKELLQVLFKRTDISEHLTLKEKIAYYQLIGEL